MSLDFLDINDVHILDETGAQVDRVTGLPYKDENLSATEKAQARVGIAANVLQITSGSFSSLPQLWSIPSCRIRPRRSLTGRSIRQTDP